MVSSQPSISESRHPAIADVKFAQTPQSWFSSVTLLEVRMSLTQLHGQYSNYWQQMFFEVYQTGEGSRWYHGCRGVLKSLQLFDEEYSIHYQSLQVTRIVYDLQFDLFDSPLTHGVHA